MGEVDLFRNSSLGVIPIFVVKIWAVQSSNNHQIGINSGGTTWQEQSGMSQQEQPGPAGMPGEALCRAFLNKVNIIKEEDMRPKKALQS